MSVQGRRKRRTLAVALAAAFASVAGLGFALQAADCPLDDAFITHRYAANLLAGHGLTFEPAAAAAEGFSSPLWLGLLTAAGAVAGTGAIPGAAALFGAAGMVLALAVLAVMGRPVAVRGELWEARAGWALIAAPSLVASLVLAVSGPAAYHATTGLETFVFLAAVAAVAGAMAGALPLVLGLVAAALAPWIRPEGLWLPIALGAQLLVARDAVHLRRAVLLGGICLLSAGFLFGARILVFGEVWPNTFLAKPPDRAEGFRYLLDGLLQPWALGLLVLAVIGAAGGGRRHRGWLLGALAWALAAVAEGGDWMPGHRFLLPCFGLLAASASGALHSLIGASPKATSPARNGVYLFGLLTLFTVGYGTWSAAYHVDLADLSRRTLRHEDRVLEGWLAEAGAGSVALIDIGEIGFRSGLEIVDLGGLTDPVIGRAPGPRLAKELDLTYLFEERRPDAVVLRLDQAPGLDRSCAGGILSVQLRAPVERRVFGASALARDYSLARALIPGYGRTPLYGRLLYLHRDLGPPPDSWRDVCEVSVDPLAR